MAVFIRGFDFETDEASIRKHCTTAGKVVSMELKGKGGALISYSNATIAQRAAEKLHKSIIPGNARYIDAKFKNVGGVVSAVVKQQPAKGNLKGGAKVQAKVFRPTSLPSAKVATQGPGRSATTKALQRKAPVAVVSVARGSVGRASGKGAVRTVAQAPSVLGGEARVEIWGWDDGTEEKVIKQHVARVGKVRFAAYEAKGERRAFLTYRSVAQAQKAVEGLHQSVIDGNERWMGAKLKGSAQRTAQVTAMSVGGKTVNVKLSKLATSQKRQAQAVKNDGRTVYVRGADQGTSKEDILEYLGSAGDITSSKFLNKTNCMVTYATTDEAELAVSTLNKTSIPGNERYLDVMIHDPKNDVSQGKKKQKTGAAKERTGPTGPELERERLTSVPVTGTVLRFKGKFGFLKPSEPFKHELAQKHGGNIYVSHTDVTSELEPKQDVQFHVYADAAGLGAEEVEII